MRTIQIDNRKVIAPNATLLGSATRTIKAGTFFIWNDAGQLRQCRSLGRIASCDSDGDDCAGYVLAMVLHASATLAFERWVNPAEIVEAYADSPAALAAFFFAPTLPYDAQTMRRLMEYGTTTNRYVSHAAATVEMFAKRGETGEIVNP